MELNILLTNCFSGLDLTYEELKHSVQLSQKYGMMCLDLTYEELKLEEGEQERPQ